MTTEDIPARLEYLRSQIQAECISYGEISELQALAAHIDAGDVELLEWAGVPEFPEDPAPAPEDPPAYVAGMTVKLLQETPEYGAWATGYIERAYPGGVYDIRVRGHHLYRVTADKVAPLTPPEDPPVIKGGALVSTNPRVPHPFPREYKGWNIDARNTRGLYVATNYSAGYGRVMADTLQGIKHMITETMAEGPKQ
jgi:hypothetical protein